MKASWVFIFGMAICSACATPSRSNQSSTNPGRSMASLETGELAIIQERTPFPSSYIFTPNDGKPHPAIVLLHGSEGGSQRNMWVHAMLLAGSGFTVMNFCWWDCDRDVRSEPMPMMTDIEVTKTVDAIQWLQKSEHVDRGVALYGISKGAELAMVLGSKKYQLPFKITALVLHSPNDVIEAGANINWLDKRCWVCPKEVTTCSYQRQYWNPSCGPIGGKYKPEDFDNLPMWRWQGEALKLGSRLELENYDGPILITAGDNDTVWRSDKDRVSRLVGALHKAERHPEIHVFPGEEHSFSLEAEQKRKALVNKFLKTHLP